MTRAAEIDRGHGRDRDPGRAGARRRRAPASGHRASASSITCSTCSPATGGWTSTCGPRGDLQTGAHHTVEDVGICLGQALDRALGDRAGITRYGQATVPMDESRASCAIDISGRGLCAFEAELPPGAIGNFDHELTEEFFRALAANARLTLHVTVETGTNAHHMIEAAFKAVARALRAAVAIDPTERGVPEHQGDADVSERPRSRSSTTGWATAARSQKALEHVGAQAGDHRDHGAICGPPTGWCVPGVGAFPRGDAQPARARARRS